MTSKKLKAQVTCVGAGGHGGSIDLDEEVTVDEYWALVVMPRALAPYIGRLLYADVMIDVDVVSPLPVPEQKKLVVATMIDGEVAEDIHLFDDVDAAKHFAYGFETGAEYAGVRGVAEAYWEGSESLKLLEKEAADDPTVEEECLAVRAKLGI